MKCAVCEMEFLGAPENQLCLDCEWIVNKAPEVIALRAFKVATDKSITALCDVVDAWRRKVHD